MSPLPTVTHQKRRLHTGWTHRMDGGLAHHPSWLACLSRDTCALDQEWHVGGGLPLPGQLLPLFLWSLPLDSLQIPAEAGTSRVLAPLLMVGLISLHPTDTYRCMCSALF